MSCQRGYPSSIEINRESRNPSPHSRRNAPTDRDTLYLIFHNEVLTVMRRLLFSSPQSSHTPGSNYRPRPLHQIQYRDGSRIISTVPALCSFLRLRAWVLDLVALECHKRSLEMRASHFNENNLAENTKHSNLSKKRARMVGFLDRLARYRLIR